MINARQAAKTTLFAIPGAAYAYREVTTAYRNRGYHAWIKRTEVAKREPAFAYQPLISIIVPAFNTPQRYLEPLLQSVLDQTYTNWELCLVNASPDDERRAAITKAAGRDKRIKDIEVKENLGIAGNTNVGIKAAKGEYIAFLDHDDTLAPFALHEAARLLQVEAGERPLMMFSDEDKLSDDGKTRLTPFFKPGFDEEFFLTSNYTCHFVVVKRSLADELGGVRLGFDGAQDYDFLLRAYEKSGGRVGHVPRMSYHWRMADGSTAKTPGEKTPAVGAGQRALQDFADRQEISATARPIQPGATSYRFHYHVEKPISVQLLATGGRRDLQVLLEQTNTAELDVSIGEASDHSDVTVLLDSTAMPTHTEWLRELALKALQPGIGVVGGVHIYGRGRAATGYVVQNGRLRARTYSARELKKWGYDGMALWPRTVIAPPTLALALKTEAFHKVHPSDQPIDRLELSLAVHKLGLRNVFWPYAAFSAPKAPRDHVITDVAGVPLLNPNLVIKRGSANLT